jgi:hypothetical protein
MDLLAYPSGFSPDILAMMSGSQEEGAAEITDRSALIHGSGISCRCREDLKR